MAISAVVKILILGISILSKCQFLSAHAQKGRDSRLSAEVTFDLYEIMCTAGKLVAEKLEMIEGRFGEQEEKIKLLEESADEGKLIADKFEQFIGQTSDQTKKIEILEGIVAEGKLMAEKIQQLEGQMSNQAEKIEQLEGKMADQAETIQKLEGIIESQKTSETEAGTIEILENKVESPESIIEGNFIHL